MRHIHRVDEFSLSRLPIWLYSIEFFLNLVNNCSTSINYLIVNDFDSKIFLSIQGIQHSLQVSFYV